MRKTILIIALFCITLSSMGQIYPYTITRKNAEILLPSYESISRIKQVERPVGLQSGVPEISIPLWSNEQSSFGIGLSYHASGIQVNELASSVGLGWSLEVGGLIARVVRGLPDDMAVKGYLHLNSSVKSMYNKDLDNYYNSDVPELNKVGDMYDESPDIFYYNFNGLKGKFILQDGKGISMPNNNLDISYTTNSNGSIWYFTIKTPDGTVCKFRMHERVEITSGTHGLGALNYTSAWYLTSIGSLESESVTLSYDAVGLFNGNDLTYEKNEERKLFEYLYFNKGLNEQTVPVSGTGSATMKFIIPRLRIIQGQNSKAEFTYGDDNTLTKIDIYALDFKGTVGQMFGKFTSIDFTYSDFLLTNSTTDNFRTKRLDKVSIGNKVKKPYFFTYNMAAIPPKGSAEQDLWGYYNANGSNSLIPQMYINPTTKEYDVFGFATANLTGANRFVNPASIEAGMLVEVENPQGGITHYTYEPQEFLYKGQIVKGGGLRVKQIDYSDPASEHPDKKIKYLYTTFNDVNNTPTGFTTYNPVSTFYISDHPLTGDQARTYTHVNIPYGISGSASPVLYKQVTIDYDGIGYTVSNFDFALPEQTSGINIFSDKLNQWQLLSNNITLPGEQYYNSAELSYKGKNFDKLFVYDLQSTYLTSEANYDLAKTKVSETVLNYYSLELPIAIHGFVTGPKTHIDENIEINSGQPGEPGGIGEIMHISTTKQYLKKYYYPTAWRLLESQESFNYINGVALSEGISRNYYNTASVMPNYRLPVKTESVDADGLIYFKEIKYPFDFVLPFDIASLIDNYTSSLTTSLANNPEAYYQSLGDEGFILNKSIPSSVVLAEPPAMQAVDEKLKVIQELKSRGQLTTPIEMIQGLEFADGTKKVTSAALQIFKKLENTAIVPSMDFVFEGETNYNSFEKAHISETTTPMFLCDPSYKMVQNYKVYSESGELTELEGLDGVTAKYTYYPQGSYLKSKAVDEFTTSYDYKPLVGKTRETDALGRNVYYTYDEDGNLLLVMDHDKNIREIYSSGTKNQEGVSFIETTPKAQFSVTKSLNYNFIKIYISGYNPAFEYVVDYGDGTTETLTTSSAKHYYPLHTDFNFSIKEMKNAYVLNQHTETINLNPVIEDFVGHIQYYVYSTTFWREIDAPSNMLSDGALKIKTRANFGLGEYTVSYDVKKYDDISRVLLDSYVTTEIIYPNETSEIEFLQRGQYQITTTITDKDGLHSISGSCSFVIGDNYFPPVE